MSGEYGPKLPNGEFYASVITTPGEQFIKNCFANTQRDRKIAAEVGQLADLHGDVEELFPAIELRIQRIARTCFAGNMRSAIEQTRTIFNALVPDPIQNANATHRWHEFLEAQPSIDTSVEMSRKTKDALKTPTASRRPGQVAKVIDFENYLKRKKT